MVLDARVLILDEPTSSLDRDEVDRLFAVIRDLRDQGVAILFVSHFLDQVYEISDRITVLRNGQLVGEYRAADLPRVRAGDQDDRPRARRARGHLARAPTRTIDRTGAPVLRATGVGRRGVLEPADLDVYDGEVVGHRRAAGLGPHRAGPAALRRRPRRRRADRGRRHARPAGLARGTPSGTASRSRPRTAGRRASSPTSRSRENIVLGIQARRGWLRKIRRAEQDAVVAEYIEALGVRPADPNAAGRQPLRRQPAEGAARPLAGHRAASCSSSTSRPAGSTSAPRPTSSARSPSCRARGSPSSSSPPSSRRCFDWPSASS